MLKIKISKMICQSMILINFLAFFVAAMPTDNSQQQTENNEEVTVTAYPDTQKRYVDLNYVDRDISGLLQRNNLQIQQIREQQEKLKNRLAEREKNRDSVIVSSSTLPSLIETPNPTSREEVEQIKLMNIHDALQATLRQPDTNANGDESSNGPERAEFDYSFAPVCEVPRGFDLQEWFQTNTWNLLFKPIYQQYNVKNVMLRIYKVAEDESKSNSAQCVIDDDDQMVSIIVSVYIRRKNKFQKKTIYTTMIERSYVGWIEIDVKGTLKYWDKPKLNYGMAIDVFDADEKQLDSRNFFYLQDCKAGPLLPWRSYQLLSRLITRNGSLSDPSVESQLQKLSTGPRLDLISYSRANYGRTSSSNEEQTRQQRHVRHEYHHLTRNHHKRNHHDTKSIIRILSSKVRNQKSNHIHRDSSQVEET